MPLSSDLSYCVAWDPCSGLPCRVYCYLAARLGYAGHIMEQQGNHHDGFYLS
jgi:hypothetical protein